MSFAEWYAMPAAERRHRKLLYYARIEAAEQDEHDRWVASQPPPTEADFKM